MKITKLHSDEKGDSHFTEVEIELTDAGEIGRLSQNYPVNEIIFRENDGDYDLDFHNAPQRQFIVLLDGEIQIETSLGEIRNFKAGEILLVEDTTGKGHRTKSVDGKLRRSLFITLGDENVKFE
jgi:homogentisate 1,2-dioxygenase